VREIAGKVQTVLGRVSPDSLGVTLPHEHLFIDCSTTLQDYKPKDPSEIPLYSKPVALENLWWVAYHPVSNRDNLILQDEETAVNEASFFRQAGGGTIVDVSSAWIGRNPQALVRVSKATGLNIVMGSGFYIAPSHPETMERLTEEEICEEIVREVTVGVGDPPVRAGIIGEIGCSWPLHDNERKALRGAARAQRLTGAPLSVHPGRNPNPDLSTCLEIIGILGEAGADISHTAVCHIERTLIRHEDRCKLAETGCYLEYDIFGWEGYHNIPTVDLPNDSYRINQIMALIDQGCIHQILVSQDICWKHRLRRYGGHGYDHILRNVVPVMLAKGVSEEQIHTLLVANPKRLLTFQ
jgi:phosphotriesterase-related protein